LYPSPDDGNADPRGGPFILIAPGTLCRDRVVAHYLQVIREAFAEELGSPVSLRIDVAKASIPSRSRKSQPPSHGSGGRRNAAPGESNRAPSIEAAPETHVAGEGRSAPAAIARVPLRRPEPARGAPARTSRERLRPKQRTFDSFQVGESNALAQAACLALAQGLQQDLSSVCLVGGTGVGKTHLAQAVIQEGRAHGLSRAVYTSAERFTSDFTGSLHRKETDRFKRRFREECDLLVLEDLGFLAGKRWTQLELFHTFEHLRAVGVPVVVTADRQPREIDRLDPRLQSQISAGLVAEIAPPERELRQKIMRRLADSGGVRLPDECLERVVDHVQGSVRDLEGALAQVVVTASLLKRPIDLSLIDQSLRKLGVRTPGRGAHSIESITREVCDLFGVNVAELREKNRQHRVMIPRQLAMYFSLRLTEASMSQIGAFFHRDHPSVRNSVKSVERRMLTRAPLRYRVEELATRLDAAAVIDLGSQARKKRG